MTPRALLSRWLGHRLAGPVLIVVIGYVGFVGLARGAYSLTNAAGGMAAFWPPNGLIVALCLLLPRRRRFWALAAIPPGELTADLLQGYHVLTSLGWAAANIVESSLAVAIVIVVAGGVPRGDRGRNYVALALGSALAPAVGALIGAAVSVASFGGSFGSAWLDWWLGDATGILLIACLIYAFAQPAPRTDLRRHVAALIELALVVATASIVFTLTTTSLEFIVLPPLIVLALRENARWTAVAGLLFSIVATVCTGHGLGPLAAVHDATQQVLGVQMFVTTTAFAGLVICGTMSERRAAEAELAHLVGHDQLTGIFNRRAFLGRLEDLAPVARRRLAVAYFDLDGFKLINDTHGHSVGDRVLTEVGRRLARAARPGDLPARLGGDEFAMVLDPVADLDEARAEMGRIAAVISSSLWIDGVEIHVGVSAGVSLYSGDIEAALGVADRGLYVQKAARLRTAASEPARAGSADRRHSPPLVRS